MSRPCEEAMSCSLSFSALPDRRRWSSATTMWNPWECVWQMGRTRWFHGTIWGRLEEAIYVQCGCARRSSWRAWSSSAIIIPEWYLCLSFSRTQATINSLELMWGWAVRSQRSDRRGPVFLGRLSTLGQTEHVNIRLFELVERSNIEIRGVFLQ